MAIGWPLGWILKCSLDLRLRYLLCVNHFSIPKLRPEGSDGSKADHYTVYICKALQLFVHFPVGSVIIVSAVMPSWQINV